MTVDERLEFLLQSTESLHSGLQELTATVREISASVREVSATVRELKETAQIDGENIRALARIAEVHERRISDLEGSAEN